MKRTIERMEVFGVEMPLVGTFTSAGISKQVTKCVVVRLTASDGTVGISSAEASSTAKSPHTAAELVVALRERVAPALIGQDPLDVQNLAEAFQDTALSLTGLTNQTSSIIKELQYLTRTSKRVLDRIEERVIEGKLWKLF